MPRRPPYTTMVHHSDHRPLLALAIRAVAAFLIATLFMLGKLAASRGVALPEMLFWLQFTSLPPLLVWLAARRRLQDVATSRIGRHMLRAVVGMTSSGLSFLAARMLPLAEFIALSFTAPLFAVLFAAFALREHVGPWRWGAVACGFAGVLVITRPGSAVFPLTGGLLALLAAASTAVVSLQVRHLGRSDDPLRAVFWYAVFGSLITAGFLPFFARSHDAGTWALLLAIGLVGALVQLTLAASLRHGALASVVVVDSTQLLWATAYGWVVWDEFPQSSLWFGAPIVLGAALTIALREHRLARKSTAGTIATEAVDRGGREPSQSTPTV